MLYHLLYPLRESFSVFNVFKYITFRSVYAGLTAMIISILMGVFFIKLLSRYQIGETIREIGPKSHLSKKGTPTMGGILILVATFISILLWGNLLNQYIWVLLFSMLSFGLLGLADDYIKVILKKKDGINISLKLVIQAAIGLCIALYVVFLDADRSDYATYLEVPFFKNVVPDLGLFYILFIVLVIVGASNAVNLTDGLDGLAIGPIIIATFSFMILTYVTGHIKFSNYLNIQYIGSVGELSVFCGALIGAGLGFLWFNSYPAQIFMGDVGSLAMGGALGTLAVLSKHELLLVIVGGLFVIEALSVLLQVSYFKISGGKRIFKMTPLHHHFEEKGWSEPKITVRFWIVAVILALLSLSTLKLR
ncbi:MAG: phospho-N-acetylmuramoyl-pentapeptide-transferase [Nitrospinota bacterium]